MHVRGTGWLASIVILALVAAGCGDDGASAVSLDSGVPPDRALGSLTPDEAQRVCDATMAQHAVVVSTEQYQDGYCRYQATVTTAVAAGMQDLTTPAMVQQCQTSYGQCRTLVKQAAGSSGRASCNFGPCASATVNDFQQCMAAMDQDWLQLFAQLPQCTSLTAGQDPLESLDPPGQPAACGPVFQCMQ